jgi:hypothetical protein
MTLPLVMAITGASGAPYAVRLLEQLLIAGQPVQLILPSHGLRLLRTETEITSETELREAVGASRWDGLVTSFDDSLGCGFDLAAHERTRDADRTIAAPAKRSAQRDEVLRRGLRTCAISNPDSAYKRQASRREQEVS